MILLPRHNKLSGIAARSGGAAGKKAGTLSAAYVLNEDEGTNLYRVFLGGQPTTLAENVSGSVSYGVLPGDVEDVLWNNTASKHIDESETGVTSVEISGSSVSAEIYWAEATGGTAYCASYGADGRMLGVSSAALTKGRNAVSFPCAVDAAAVKIFVLDGGTCAPLCAAWEKAKT